MAGDWMIDFNANIVSGTSIGNVFINSKIDDYVNEMYSSFEVKQREYALPDDSIRISYVLNDTLTIATMPDGNIFSVGCNVKYKGLYKGILFAGQAMGEIVKVTCRQRIFNGSIIVDDDFGFSFVLPPPYDEIADSIDQIPMTVTLNEIYVSDFSSWNPKLHTGKS
ncbi:hypothetical protein [Chitinivorax sp. B]|uniref:hypothetical protein n=1 Tax=Chitinivorax sp. B TaxID=2502235 RepID=UPI002017407F|nr:hypothetical protein [Chitinivorax sp. B]